MGKISTISLRLSGPPREKSVEKDLFFGECNDIEFGKLQ